jgi:glycerol uptake facilitator-like aquaporin
MKAYLAELLGTLTLTLVVLTTSVAGPALATPLAVALALALCVYTLGPISGSHLNPAITLGLWSIGKIRSWRVLNYIVAQFIGAGIALVIFRSLGLTPTQFILIDSWTVGWAEAVGAFFFGLGIAAVVNHKVATDFSGLVVGGSLLLGLSMAGAVSLAVLNPAIAIGLNLLSFAYILGPIIGSILGMQVYRWLSHHQQ